MLLTSHKTRKLGHRVKVTTLRDQTTLIMALKSEFEWIQLNYCIFQAGRQRFFFFLSHQPRKAPSLDACAAVYFLCVFIQPIMPERWTIKKTSVFKARALLPLAFYLP